MGTFANDVRYGKRAGPSQRGFDRVAWEAAATPAFDEDDARVHQAGLLFDVLLTQLRSWIALDDIQASPGAAVQLAVAVCNRNLVHLQRDMEGTFIRRNGAPVIDLPDLLEQKLPSVLGELFAPDELITGMGDGLKHMLRQLIARGADTLAGSAFTADTIDATVTEINKAIIYQCAVEYWHDCQGNTYGVSAEKDGLFIRPSNAARETARVLSIYRRNNLSLQFGLQMTMWWRGLDAVRREKISRIILPRKLHGVASIERIELGNSPRVLGDAATALGEALAVQIGYYRGFLDEGLPRFNGVTLALLIDTWRFLQAVGALMNDGLLRLRGEIDTARCAPSIPLRVLVPSVARSLGIAPAQAQLALEALTFDGSPARDLWCQPLVRIGDAVILMLPCILSARLLRIVEGWMRQGGIKLDRRGTPFEAYCRNELKKAADACPLAGCARVLDSAVVFAPPAGRSEEIDVVAVIGRNILIIEVKCILWPDDALQFTNYHDTVVGATAQIERKRVAAVAHLEAFKQCLRDRGCTVPDDAFVTACVLTNSPVYSGFPINGVPVVDTAMIGHYLANRYTKAEMFDAGRSVHRHDLTFYDTVEQAADRLHAQLASPVELSDIRQYVTTRTVQFPLAHSLYGPVFHQTYEVVLDRDALQQRYGPALAGAVPAVSSADA
jgi:hypothetical protein